MMPWRIDEGEALDVLRTLEPESIQTCVTSPPYWQMRDYRVARQLGREKTVGEYVARLVGIFEELRRVLRKDGTLWLNLGDCFTSDAWGGSIGANTCLNGSRRPHIANMVARKGPRMVEGRGPKNLVGVPWRVAFAMQDAGWLLRQCIVWAKPNPMPESCEDRPTTAHEFVFLFSLAERYYFNAAAIAERAVGANEHDLAGPGYAPTGQAPHTGTRSKRRTVRDGIDTNGGGQGGGVMSFPAFTRNKRSVWTIPTQPFPKALAERFKDEPHYAAMPEALAEPCILAGSRPGDVVEDPFTGAATVGLVATRLGRSFHGSELNPRYVEMGRWRIENDAPLFNRPEALEKS